MGVCPQIALLLKAKDFLKAFQREMELMCRKVCFSNRPDSLSGEITLVGLDQHLLKQETEHIIAPMCSGQVLFHEVSIPVLYVCVCTENKCKIYFCYGSESKSLKLLFQVI